MSRQPIDNSAPQGRTPGPVRIIGILVVAALIISCILLALGVVNFEQLGFF
ncbi:MAG: hypothetical protein AVDCRST_MAG62-577 [uncultured Sphingomonas sp.]|uniref:Uncharacterized protein n=1 Tax=uncultured Sphingomonas sp. TaxID=158754 RepID=A0A6J4T2E3_9SPHN|nr:MAG: hypothetical protein AVDCRST_MAG62-577 [uncultured Sphingomonas sp.]